MSVLGLCLRLALAKWANTHRRDREAHVNWSKLASSRVSEVKVYYDLFFFAYIFRLSLLRHCSLRNEFYFQNVLYIHIFSIHSCTSKLPAVAMACMNCFYLLLFESMVFSVYFVPCSHFRQCAFFILQVLASALFFFLSRVFYLLLRVFVCACAVCTRPFTHIHTFVEHTIAVVEFHGTNFIRHIRKEGRREKNHTGIGENAP